LQKLLPSAVTFVKTIHRISQSRVTISTESRLLAADGRSECSVG
jgi:hypothetical protein